MKSNDTHTATSGLRIFQHFLCQLHFHTLSLSFSPPTCAIFAGFLCWLSTICYHTYVETFFCLFYYGLHICTCANLKRTCTGRMIGALVVSRTSGHSTYQQPIPSTCGGLFHFISLSEPPMQLIWNLPTV